MEPNKEYKTEVRNLLSQNKVEKSLKFLLSKFNHSSISKFKDEYNQLIILQGRLAGIDKDLNLDIIDRAEGRQEKNNIALGIMNILKDLPTDLQNVERPSSAPSHSNFQYQERQDTNSFEEQKKKTKSSSFQEQENFQSNISNRSNYPQQEVESFSISNYMSPSSFGSLLKRPKNIGGFIAGLFFGLFAIFTVPFLIKSESLETKEIGVSIVYGFICLLIYVVSYTLLEGDF